MKMSITRALAELKRIDDRATAAISSSRFLAVKVGQNQNAKVYGRNETVAAVEADIQGSFDKIEALLKNRAELKSKIVMSNAVTKVTVGGVDMVVAEAIELKKSVQLKEQLVSALRRHVMTTNMEMTALRNKLEDTIDRSMQAIYAADKSKITSDQYELVAKPQLERFEPSLIDPKDILETIKKLDEEISVVRTELDFILSESNARTDIEVSF